MILMKSERPPRFNRLAVLLSLGGLLAGLCQTQAQPTIALTVPVSGDTGVSTTTTVVFIFSAAMDTGFTEAAFIDLSDPFNPITTSPSWSAGNTVLTCTPVPSFPANKTIYWTVDGQNLAGDPLEGTPFGSFTTGSGGGSSGGTGTNATTSFALGKTHAYHQTSTGLPTLDTNAPYAFGAITSLSSNRTATNVLLTLPTSSVFNLGRNPFALEQFALIAFNTNMTTFDADFPSGNYTFNVQAVASNQAVIVNLPSTLLQPGAPHVTNYAAAQSVDSTQPFVLAWDALPGGGSSDFVYVVIGSVYSSADIDSPGALPGTATTFTIPAGKLQAGSNYDSEIGFYRSVSTTNGSNYVTTAYRVTVTDFTLITTGDSGSGSPVLTNAAFAPANFSFDVLCSTGQTVTVEYRTNLAAGQWQTLLTTNSPGSRFRAVAPQAATNRFLFFRARNGT